MIKEKMDVVMKRGVNSDIIELIKIKKKIKKKKKMKVKEIMIKMNLNLYRTHKFNSY